MRPLILLVLVLVAAAPAASAGEPAGQVPGDDFYPGARGAVITCNCSNTSVDLNLVRDVARLNGLISLSDVAPVAVSEARRLASLLPELNETMGAADAEEMVWGLLKWIAYNFVYVEDAYYYYVWRPNEIRVTGDIYYTPLRLYLHGGGDCDDFALLVYSLVKALRTDMEPYIIGWFKGGVGHVAVLIITRDKRAYLVDPTILWVNGRELVFMFKIYINKSMSATVPVAPLALSRLVKLSLDPRLYELKLYDTVTGKYINYPPVTTRIYLVGERDLARLLSDWIRATGGRGANTITVYHDLETIRYGSVEEAATALADPNTSELLDLVELATTVAKFTKNILYSLGIR